MINSLKQSAMFVRNTECEQKISEVDFSYCFQIGIGQRHINNAHDQLHKNDGTHQITRHCKDAEIEMK